MKLICINCPKGCELEVTQRGPLGDRPLPLGERGGLGQTALPSEVEVSGASEVVVAGAGCPRGEAYGKAELINPTRMVTGLVRVAGMKKPLPVKTKRAIPKGKINEVLFAMHQATVQLPVAIGDVIIPNVADTRVDLVATANYGE